MLSTSRLERLAAKELIGRRGDFPDTWTGVLSGIVKASFHTVDGRTHSFVLAYPGEWIEECDIINATCRMYDIATLTQATVLRISADTFRTLNSNSFEFAAFAMKALTSRHMRLIVRSHVDRISSKEASVAKLLAELTEFSCAARQGACVDSGELFVTQEDVAEIVGLTRQTVNEAINSLVEKKLIGKRRGRITVQSIGGLRSSFSAVLAAAA
ncbi:MAG TPA: Crp/Fnr family transcriptional regulator [Ramlibacter sp.]|uniref:Crp/Fnr family transcriptional regulator n=1 Tax=Ramlibacter sp. TaxID=1917967 RepID=UPI002C152E3B|nr:Crp/Fnr family transcriptional regulator [Ramlibacter sp.]HVZ46599.1 Crp/Fnr family transcriptional regulator [Ramlibacter sp.]